VGFPAIGIQPIFYGWVIAVILVGAVVLVICDLIKVFLFFLFTVYDNRRRKQKEWRRNRKRVPSDLETSSPCDTFPTGAVW